MGSEVALFSPPPRAQLHRRTGALELKIPVDFGNGPQYIELGINLMSAPVDAVNTPGDRETLKRAIKRALTGDCMAVWNNGQNTIRAPLSKALTDVVESKMKDTL